MAEFTDILFSTAGNDQQWGVITLNRPKAMNALNQEMCQALYNQLLLWATDDAIKGVIVEACEGRAFCAGGDINFLRDKSMAGDVAGATAFFRVEYNMNSLIHHFPKPYISLWDGVVMGGGIGISISSSHIVATENTLWAMPETGIGLIPDVGGTKFLGDLDGGMGMFLGLTGARLKGAESVHAGVATHHVKAEELAGVKAQLIALDLSNDQDEALSQVDQVMAANHQDTDISGVLVDRAKIDQHFENVSSMEDLMAGLSGDDTEFAAKQHQTLARMSPTSMKLTIRGINDAKALDFDGALKMEFDVVYNIMAAKADFVEGVRAQIIDKDRNPTWVPPTLADVRDQDVDAYFVLSADKQLQLTDFDL